MAKESHQTMREYRWVGGVGWIRIETAPRRRSGKGKSQRANTVHDSPQTMRGLTGLDGVPRVKAAPRRTIGERQPQRIGTGGEERADGIVRVVAQDEEVVTPEDLGEGRQKACVVKAIVSLLKGNTSFGQHRFYTSFEVVLQPLMGDHLAVKRFKVIGGASKSNDHTN
jgi:hypothetical protein